VSLIEKKTKNKNKVVKMRRTSSSSESAGWHYLETSPLCNVLLSQWIKRLLKIRVVLGMKLLTRYLKILKCTDAGCPTTGSYCCCVWRLCRHL